MAIRLAVHSKEKCLMSYRDNNVRPLLMHSYDSTYNLLTSSINLTGYFEERNVLNVYADF
jgi:hypothetical protein